ncbi:hypothetical protein [Acidilobus sp.]|uniref:hypothetical protein n=1 Tax=Acidilobus sp. TaxID=1872109 RepID=UPI003CFE30F9
MLARAEAGVRAYREVVERMLGYPEVNELNTAMHFDGFISCDELCAKLLEIMERVSGKEVCVVGPLASPDEIRGCNAIMAPEGGVISLLEAGLRPLAVTTDGDSSLQVFYQAAEVSDYVLLHIHGDNLNRVSSLAKEIPRSKLLITSQVYTPYCVYPSGAFTDGDRAIAISMEMGADEVKVFGFNFDLVSCAHKDYCADTKLQKLRAGREVLLNIASGLGYSVDIKNNLMVFSRVNKA